MSQPMPQSMHYALNPRTFLFSHYFYTGLRTAIGIIGLTSLVLWRSDLASAMTVCIGALCTSFMDLNSPLRHKFHEMLASVVLCSVVTLVITLAAPIHWLLGVMVVVVSFLASMMLIYGKKTMPLQFAALFIMTLSMENDLSVHEALMHSALFFAGAAVYMAYAMAAAWLLRNRIKQQVLAEALFELARYIEIKSEFYDMRTNLNDQFNQLVRQQSVLADKQQAARDLILRGKPGQRDAILIQIHFGMLDLYELILSTHTDYALLRRHLADADVLTALHGMAHKAALDTESIAFAVTRNRASAAEIDYGPERRAIENEIARLTAMEGDAHHETLTVLRTSYNKLANVVDTIALLHQATHTPVSPLPLLPGADMAPFLTTQKYGLGLLLANLNWKSPTYRFALRIAMAISTGLLIAEHLPYASHGYWIILTIAIVLKPTFSMTRQRLGDRLIGTAIGCTLTAVIVHFVHAPAALLAFLFLATVATSAFVYVKYRYTAIAASMQILLQYSLLMHSTTHVIGERLIDTCIGVAIAAFFSFVLPSWEYRALPQLIGNVLAANRRYIAASCDLLIARASDDFIYRLSRKGLFDSLASLSSALVRMLDEPASKHRAVEDMHLFIVQNYLIVAHVAALRVLLRRHVIDMPKAQVDAQIQHACAGVWTALAELQKRLAEMLPKLAAPDADAEGVQVPSNAGTPAGNWSGWTLLQRRLGLLRADADVITRRGLLIGRTLSQPE
ncbi:MAG TPA: FUSC family membrane protein [Burkholderiaceae bacterium]